MVPPTPDPLIPPPPPLIHESTPSPLWYPPPPPPLNEGLVIVILVVALVGCLLVFALGVLKRYCNSRDRAVAAAWSRALPRALPQLEPSQHFVELRLRQARPSFENPAARPRLPAFKYNRSVKQNVIGEGEEAATCSVCLGAFQQGETVRLLPVCLHLFHVECIDPWLDAHSTCPICRSDTDPMIPPV